jgi:hypothetical protein
MGGNISIVGRGRSHSKNQNSLHVDGSSAGRESLTYFAGRGIWAEPILLRKSLLGIGWRATASILIKSSFAACCITAPLGSVGNRSRTQERFSGCQSFQ